MKKSFLIVLFCFISMAFFGFTANDSQKTNPDKVDPKKVDHITPDSNPYFISNLEVKTEIVPSSLNDKATDLNITREVQSALASDNTLPADAKKIIVVTENGTVVLKGTVANQDEASIIVKKIESIKGVKKVDNKLEIRQMR